jgi:hypothetical protein
VLSKTRLENLSKTLYKEIKSKGKPRGGKGKSLSALFK